MFILVEKLTVMQTLQALTTRKNWNMWQTDEKNIFLYRELDRRYT